MFEARKDAVQVAAAAAAEQGRVLRLVVSRTPAAAALESGHRPAPPRRRPALDCAATAPLPQEPRVPEVLSLQCTSVRRCRPPPAHGLPRLTQCCQTGARCPVGYSSLLLLAYGPRSRALTLV